METKFYPVWSLNEIRTYPVPDWQAEIREQLASWGLVGEPDADGWVRAVVPIETIEHAVNEFGRFGANLEVLSPPELRDRMRASALAMLELYGS